MNLWEVPNVTVVGVGGGGINALEDLISSGQDNIRTIAMDTNSAKLAMSQAKNKLQLGPELTRGRGSGANQALARQAAEKVFGQIEETRQFLFYSSMFVIQTAPS